MSIASPRRGGGDMHEQFHHGGYDRVRAHSSKKVNAMIDRVTEASLARADRDPNWIETRSRKLDREWGIERSVALVFAGMGTVALTLGLVRSRRWKYPLFAQI